MFQNNLLMGAASISAGGITVDNSVLYNDDDSPRLTRTPTTVGNRRTSSLSLWYKRCTLGSIQQLFNAGAGDDITFNASDKLTFTDSSGVSYITTQVFRDITAWGHLLFAWDTTLATAGDRLRIYHNGVEITAFDTETNPDHNDEFEINNTVLHTIGANESGTEEFDGYFSQVYLVDGSQLTPTDFGEFDDNGVWRPIEYAGTDGSAVTLTFVEQGKSDSSATTYTFSGVDLGGTSSDHIIIGAVGRMTSAASPSISSITVDGVAAVEMVNSAGSAGYLHGGLWIAEATGDSTGDVVIVFGSGCNAAAYAVWRASNVGQIVFDTLAVEGGSGTDPSGNISIPAGGALVCLADTTGSSKSFSWTNATEVFDADAGDGDNYYSGTADTFAAQTTDRTITVDQGSATSRMECASIGPTVAYGINGFKLDFSNSTLLGLDAAGAAASSTTYRYLKLNVTDNGASSTYVSLAEMQYYVGATLYPTQTMSSNTAPSPLVASASEDTGTGAELAFKAFDDNINTHWQTANGTVTGWLKIDLGSGNGIAPDSFRLGSPETPDRTPNDFTIQGSNNDSDWTVLATYAGFSTPTPTARTYSGYAPITTGNNFVSSGLTTTDQVTDTPTNNYPTINVLMPGSPNHTYSEGNLKVFDANTSTNDTSRVSTIAIPKGSDTWAVKMTCIAALEGHAIGVGDQNTETGDVQGFNQSGVHGVWYNQLGKIYINGSLDTSGKATLKSANDVIECHVDMSAGDVEFFVNNSSQGSYALPSGYEDDDIDLFFHCDTGIGDNTLLFDFGQMGYNPATNLAGSKRLSSSTIPATTILDGTAYFQTTLYTGNGSSRNIDQIENSTFQPDMVWIKNRSAADSHMLIDAARGVTKELNPDDYVPESTDSNGLTSFDSDGFGLGSGAGGYNDNTENFVAWQWLAGGGSGSSNEDGTINTITTTANATSGISVGTYTGSGSAATIGHGLSAAPEFVVCKEASSDGVGGQWFVYHQYQNATPEDFYLIWDEGQRAVDNSAMWNDTAPTSTVFSIGNNNDINASGSTYLYIALVGIEGYSKFGSYTGNANANGPFVYTGFKPEFVVTKTIVDSTSWVMKSATINPYNAITKTLLIDTAAAEVSTNNIDFLSNGFKMRSTTADSNKTGTTIVYMAFAEYPFGGVDVTPSTTF